MTRTEERVASAVILALILSLGPAAGQVAGQDSDDGSSEEEGGAAAELVFEREIFQYPPHPRDPFRPLTEPGAGPRFEDLTLLGVIAAESSESSIALVGVGSTDRGDAERVRLGDAIGNMRVVAVRDREIVLEVPEFGDVERRPLRVRRPGEGAGVDERGDGDDGTEDEGDEDDGDEDDGDDADGGRAPFDAVGIPDPNAAGGSR